MKLCLKHEPPCWGVYFWLAAALKTISTARLFVIKQGFKQAVESHLPIYVNKMTFISANGLTVGLPEINFRTDGNKNNYDLSHI